MAVTCCRAYAVSMLHVALACDSNRAGLATHWHCYLCIIAISKSLQGCCWWDAVVRIIRLLQERHACVHAWSCCLVSKSAGLPLSPVSIETAIAVLQAGGPCCLRNPCIEQFIITGAFWIPCFARLCLGHSVCFTSSRQVLAQGRQH